MDKVKIVYYLNGLPVVYMVDKTMADLLSKDDTAVINFVCESIRKNEVDFLSAEDLPTLEITRPSICELPAQRSATKKSIISENIMSTVEGDDSNNNNITGSTQESKGGISDEESLEKDTPILKNVWFHKGKPTTDDDEATQVMLELRASKTYMHKFADKKTVKLNLWRELATKMCDMGYFVDAEKCRQKFANLQKQFVEFVRHVNKTGVERKEPPKFYEILHMILGDKDKETLKDVQDSFDNVRDTVRNEDIDLVDTDQPIFLSTEPQPSTSKEKKKISENKKSERPPSITKQDIFSEIKKQGERQDHHMQKFCTLMEEQNSQRAEFINILKVISQQESLKPQKKNKKRRRSSSTSD